MSARRALPRIAISLLIASFVVLLICWWQPWIPHHVRVENDLKELCEWLDEELEPGTYSDYPVPSRWSRYCDHGTADVVISPDRSVLVLVKTDIGWKGNYRGYIYRTRPISESDLFTDYYGSDAFDFPGAPAPAIERRLSPHLLDVYFDLG
jgi:hypothetical protein